jgi:putative ABC transport system permease protein
MNLSQVIIEALESISSNKLRSGLTVLGIVIGVAAVIAMLAVGNGAQDSITGSISGIGTNLLFVFEGNQSDSVRNAQPLTLQDADALADPFAAPSVQAVSPVLQTNGEVSYGGEVTTTSIVGALPSFFPDLRRPTSFLGAGRDWSERRSGLPGSPSASSACWRRRAAVLSEARMIA